MLNNFYPSRRLPVPKLEDTAARYARSLQALEGHPDVDQQSIKDTERAIKLFMQNDGPRKLCSDCVCRRA